MASSAGVNENKVSGFSVSSSPTRRLKMISRRRIQTRSIRRLDALWTVSFTIAAPLSEVSAESPQDFEGHLVATFASHNFAEKVSSTIPNSFVQSETVVTVRRSRRPSSLPTFAPSPAPTSMPTPFQPHEDPDLIAWWSLNADFSDFTGSYNLTSVLSFEAAKAPSDYFNITSPSQPSDAGFFRESGYSSSLGCYGPTERIPNQQAASTPALTGATSPALATFPERFDVESKGFTLTGWYKGVNGGKGGPIFGWGEFFFFLVYNS